MTDIVLSATIPEFLGGLKPLHFLPCFYFSFLLKLFAVSFSLVHPTSCTCSGVLNLFHLRTHYNTKHWISSSTASAALVVLWPLPLSIYTVLAECEASTSDFASAEAWDIEFKCFLASLSDLTVSLAFTVHWLNAWTYLCVGSSDAIYCVLYLIYIFCSLPTNVVIHHLRRGFHFLLLSGFYISFSKKKMRLL